MEYRYLNPNAAKGQALVEYSLILLLVAVVVVVVLALFGPAIGQTYSNVVTGLEPMSSPSHATAVPTSAPTAVPTVVPTPSWTFCADEDYYCAFSGTKQVRYGANGTYTEMTLTGGTMCTNHVFGDPLYLVVKHCDIR